MEEKENIKHTNEFGEIEVLGDTKYWFKRDMQTIKKSLMATLKVSPAVLVTMFVFVLLIIRYVGTPLNFSEALVYTLALFPIFLLGYFMLHIMVTKGYNIDPYAGTHIDTPKYINRFSVGYILGSQMSLSRKILHLSRMFVYLMFIVGLLLHILMSFGE